MHIACAHSVASRRNGTGDKMHSLAGAIPKPSRIGIGEIRALDHENVDSLRCWINPCLSAVGASVTKGARGKHGGDALRLADDAPTPGPGPSPGGTST